MKMKTVAILAGVAFLAAASAFADVYRVKVSSTAPANGVLCQTETKLNAHNPSGEQGGTLVDVTIYAAVKMTNTVQRISADGAITNTVTVIHVSAAQVATVSNAVDCATFAGGDTLRIVSDRTNATFKAQAVVATPGN